MLSELFLLQLHDVVDPFVDGDVKGLSGRCGLVAGGLLLLLGRLQGLGLHGDAIFLVVFILAKLLYFEARAFEVGGRADLKEFVLLLEQFAVLALDLTLDVLGDHELRLAGVVDGGLGFEVVLAAAFLFLAQAVYLLVAVLDEGLLALLKMKLGVELVLDEVDFVEDLGGGEVELVDDFLGFAAIDGFLLIVKELVAGFCSGVHKKVLM